VYVCICNAVTDTEIREAVATGARSLGDLTATLGVASCCGRCADCATTLVEACCRELAEPVGAD
jgi:bacterioferritin-associated ferredoxin